MPTPGSRAVTGLSCRQETGPWDDLFNTPRSSRPERCPGVDAGRAVTGLAVNYAGDRSDGRAPPGNAGMRGRILARSLVLKVFSSVAVTHDAQPTLLAVMSDARRARSFVYQRT